MSGIRKILKSVGRAVLAFGTAGLSKTEARQIHVCTIGALCIIASGPFFAASSIHNGIEFGSKIVTLNWALNPILLSPYFMLAKIGRTAWARIAFVLGVNFVPLLYTRFHGVDLGLYHYAPAAGLLPFFVFSFEEWRRLVACVLFTAVSFAFATYEFKEPLAGFALPNDLVQSTWTLNFINAFLLTVFLFAFILSQVRRREDELDRFSGAVSEYLDASLVERLRGGTELEPAIRELSVFFSDLVGSTRLSFAMEKEDFGRMINDYVREMQQIIKAHGAYIEDVSGDGILGYIGNFDTRGTEQDAIDVVALCVEMRARLAELVPNYRQQYGLPGDLRVRIGVSSGPATVGKTAGARAIYTANGDVINLGAKLEKKVGEISPDGGILISEATAGLVRGRFELERHQLDIDGVSLTAYSIPDARIAGRQHPDQRGDGRARPR